MAAILHPSPPTETGVDHGRVLVVDDSAVARTVIGRLVDATEHWAVVRSVGTIGAALAYLAVAPVDVILLDIHMPGRDGLSALPELRATAPHARIIVVSSSEQAGIEAMTLGAAAAVTKASPSSFPGSFRSALIEVLDRLPSAPGTTPVATPTGSPPRSRPGADPLPQAAADFDLVAIGASTGGIHALSGVLAGLPTACRLPIIITQHLPASFMPFFAAQLSQIARRPCDVAVDRTRVLPGRILVAPGDAHLRAVALSDGGTALRLFHDPQPSGCMPSVDPMFTSLAALHGVRLLAIVLSGMGRDGAIGAAAVRRAGGAVVVQDCASSVVWGMPGTIAAADEEAAVLPPAEIGRVIASGRRPR